MSTTAAARTGPQGQSLVVESQAAMVAKARRAAKAEMLAAKQAKEADEAAAGEPAWKIAAREAEAEATVRAEEGRAPLEDEQLESLFTQAMMPQGLVEATPNPSPNPSPNSSPSPKPNPTP